MYLKDNEYFACYRIISLVYSVILFLFELSDIRSCCLRFSDLFLLWSFKSCAEQKTNIKFENYIYRIYVPKQLLPCMHRPIMIFRYDIYLLFHLKLYINIPVVITQNPMSWRYLNCCQPRHKLTVQTITHLDESRIWFVVALNCFVKTMPP